MAAPATLSPRTPGPSRAERLATAAVTLLSATLAYLVTMPQHSQHDLVPALDDQGTWRVLAGTVYSLVTAFLFSLGIGTLLRSTAATVTVALTVLLLLPGALSCITLDWVQAIVSCLPLPASSTLLTTGTAPLGRRDPLHRGEPGRRLRIRGRPDRGGNRDATPPGRLMHLTPGPRQMIAVAGEIFAVTGHLRLHR